MIFLSSPSETKLIFFTSRLNEITSRLICQSLGFRCAYKYSEPYSKQKKTHYKSIMSHRRASLEIKKTLCLLGQNHLLAFPLVFARNCEPAEKIDPSNQNRGTSIFMHKPLIIHAKLNPQSGHHPKLIGLGDLDHILTK